MCPINVGDKVIWGDDSSLQSGDGKPGVFMRSLKQQLGGSSEGQQLGKTETLLFQRFLDNIQLSAYQQMEHLPNTFMLSLPNTLPGLGIIEVNKTSTDQALWNIEPYGREAINKKA